MQDTSGAEPNVRPPHPVAFDVVYPERLSRLTTFFRLILVIPQLIVVYLLTIPLYILTIIAWFAILFTGRYPKAFFEFNTGITRWLSNVGAYTALLRDEYPPFSMDAGAYPLTLDIPYPERQSRFRLFVRGITILPNYIVFYFVQIAFFFTTFIAWWAILFTGRYPRGLHTFAVGVHRWQHRQFAYMVLLRDEYPPYSINADARPGNEVVSGIIGAPFFAAYLGLYALYLSAFAQGGGSVETSLRAIERTQPSAHSRSLRITLEGYDDDARASDLRGRRIVSFDVRAEKDGRWPAFFTPYLFSADVCEGRNVASVEDVVDETTQFDMYFRGGSDTATVYFMIPEGSTVCEVSYFTFSGQIRFIFR